MTGKRISIGSRPVADSGAEDWIRQSNGADKTASSSTNIYTARLTIDVTPALRGRVKIAAFRQGVTVADMVRALLEREFPDEPNSDP
jgi:hypothetical protein